ncbi:hypothetical protein [Helicobacter sp. T3_23-1056]
MRGNLSSCHTKGFSRNIPSLRPLQRNAWQSTTKNATEKHRLPRIC